MSYAVKNNPEYLSMLDMLSSWYAMREKLLAGDITQDEYDEWRYTYPKVEAEHFKQELDELRSKKKKSK